MSSLTPEQWYRMTQPYRAEIRRIERLLRIVCALATAQAALIFADLVLNLY